MNDAASGSVGYVRRKVVVVARRDVIVLILAIAGGCVDAAVLLAFGVLTAAQTGNTVLLAAALAQGHLAAVVSTAVSVAGYVAGAAFGELVIVERGDAASGVPAVGRTLLVELVSLGSLLVAWHLAGPQPAQGTIGFLVAFAALAMGMQSAAVLKLHAGPTTTYVTGTLTSFATKLTEWLHLVETAPPSSPIRQDLSGISLLSAGGAGIYGATWIVYALGAVVGALLYLRVGELVLVLPISAVGAATVADARDRAGLG
jgi:uncharacterized membrane protein YoaK (UPF0700 family)